MTTKMCSSYTGWSQPLNQTLKSNKIYTYIVCKIYSEIPGYKAYKCV